jgi:hypothetical protein
MTVVSRAGIGVWVVFAARVLLEIHDQFSGTTNYPYNELLQTGAAAEHALDIQWSDREADLSTLNGIQTSVKKLAKDWIYKELINDAAKLSLKITRSIKKSPMIESKQEVFSKYVNQPEREDIILSPLDPVQFFCSKSHLLRSRVPKFSNSNGESRS